MKNGLTLVASVDGNGGHIIKKPVTYHQNARRENVTFEIFEESDGTRRLLDIIPAIDLYLKGATVVIDEVNESLHPSLLKTIMAKIMGSSPPTAASSSSPPTKAICWTTTCSGRTKYGSSRKTTARQKSTPD